MPAGTKGYDEKMKQNVRTGTSEWCVVILNWEVVTETVTIE